MFTDDRSLVNNILQRLDTLEKNILAVLQEQRVQKEWYTTTEVAELLGVSQHTVQENWCNCKRIECEKDAQGKWRIPGHEVQRLLSGGGLRPKRQ